MGCWKSSVLAKRIPHMHVKNISDSNSNFNLYTLLLRVHLVLTLCYLCWWSFLSPTSAFTLVAHVVQILCYLHRWSFSTSNYRIYSTATCGGAVVTCTVWWWWLMLLALVVFFYFHLPHLLCCHMWWPHCYLHCVVVVVVVVDIDIYSSVQHIKAAGLTSP